QVDPEKSMFKTYSEEEVFLNALIAFAQADGTGSIYAFWLPEDTKDLDQAPIVTFGSEGGFHIIAQNIKALLEMLSLDVEPMIDWEEAYFFKDEGDYEASPYRDQYQAWLRDNYQIAAITDAGPLVEQAQESFQEKFKDWMGQYYAG
ncbi:MAG: hypothetical protein AAFU64_14565, partial [Bacteroidota bacterium]